MFSNLFYRTTNQNVTIFKNLLIISKYDIEILKVIICIWEYTTIEYSVNMVAFLIVCVY